jgi:hypothetical protein
VPVRADGTVPAAMAMRLALGLDRSFQGLGRTGTNLESLETDRGAKKRFR